LGQLERGRARRAERGRQGRRAAAARDAELGTARGARVLHAPGHQGAQPDRPRCRDAPRAARRREGLPARARQKLEMITDSQIFFALMIALTAAILAIGLGRQLYV